MIQLRVRLLTALIVASYPLAAFADTASKSPQVTKATIDGTGLGWRELGEADFVNVNCAADTWSWKDGVAHCTGEPTGVIRSRRTFTNFEFTAQWRHLRDGGNSGFFVWAPPKPLLDLKPDQLPHGVEVQVLDHGYSAQYEKQSGKKADWFTTDGDVFPLGKTRMKPFSPVAPDGKRSFPRKKLSRGRGQWNHYYVRAVNGEVRLWVNGEEVSGGTAIEPRTGYFCLESEGSPVEFRHVRLRELP